MVREEIISLIDTFLNFHKEHFFAIVKRSIQREEVARIDYVITGHVMIARCTVDGGERVQRCM